MAFEPFVSADEAAKFLSIKRKQLLELARKQLIKGHPIGAGALRRTWVFRLSELSSDLDVSRPKPPHSQLLGSAQGYDLSIRRSLRK